MSARRAPTREQARRRRLVAGLAVLLVFAAFAYLAVELIDLDPLDKHGSELVHLEVQSEAVGRDLGVNVIVPPRAGPRGERSLIVFLHGRGGSEVTFNDVVLEGLSELKRGPQPVVAFPDGGVDGAADFERNDVIGTVEEDPEAFGEARVWNDYGSEDDFRVYDEGFADAMNRGDAEFVTHTWPGGHEGSYWAEHWPDYQRFYVEALVSCADS